MEHLTERQKAVLAFCKNHVEETKRFPTVREIANHFGFASTMASRSHLVAMVRKGALERDGRYYRIAGENTNYRKLLEDLTAALTNGKPYGDQLVAALKALG